VRNGGKEHLDIVRAGNEAVLRARFADAAYFFRADTAHTLEDYASRLATLTFQEKLGSMLDKVARVQKMAPALAKMLALDADDRAALERAAALFKNDLVTHMVVELTSLQGIMGREYALLSGESPAVACALFEHYLPRSQGDSLPATRPGLALGIANRLDSLVGLFGVGLAPTSTADPFGLRRDALGLVQALIGARQSFDLRPALKIAAREMPFAVSDETLADVLAFIRDRLYVWLRNLSSSGDEADGLPHDVVTAILAAQGHDPAQAAVSARALYALTQSPEWNDLLVAYARSKRIVRGLAEEYPLVPELYVEPAAKALYTAWLAAAARIKAAPPDLAVAVLGEVLRDLRVPVNRFFTDLLVMADDPAVREARLALVQRIAALPDGIADLAKLQGF
jgi:glycyl-tRNA synthetase